MALNRVEQIAALSLLAKPDRPAGGPPMRPLHWLAGHLYDNPRRPRRITCLALFVIWYTLTTCTPYGWNA